jgi:hypothetical protein
MCTNQLTCATDCAGSTWPDTFRKYSRAVILPDIREALTQIRRAPAPRSGRFAASAMVFASVPNSV